MTKIGSTSNYTIQEMDGFKKQRSTSMKRFFSLIMGSWWMLLFFLGMYSLSSTAFSKKNQHIKRLQAQLLELDFQKKNACERQKNLLTEIDSHSDPEWIELILKKKLGVVPEGHIKVRFKSEAEDPLYFEGV